MPLHPHPITAAECAICLESFEEVKKQEEQAEHQPQKSGLYGLYKCDRPVCTIVYCMPCLVHVATEAVGWGAPIECSICFHPFDATALRNSSRMRNKAEAIPSYDFYQVKATRQPIDCVAAWHTYPGRPRAWYGQYDAYEALVLAHHPYGAGKDERQMVKRLAWDDWWNFWRAYFGCAKRASAVLGMHTTSPFCRCGCWSLVLRARSIDVRLRPSDIKAWNRSGFGNERLIVIPDTLQVRVPGGMLQLVPDKPDTPTDVAKGQSNPHSDPDPIDLPVSSLTIAGPQSSEDSPSEETERQGSSDHSAK